MTRFYLAIMMVMFVQTPKTSTQEDRFQRAFDVGQGATLVVNNRKGIVHVSGSDSGQVLVSVYKRYDGPSKDKIAWLNETRIDFTTDSKHLKVEVIYPDPECKDDSCDDGRDLSGVELTIQVPRQINLELTGRKPDIFVSSIEGDIKIESRKSPILIESTTGAVRINTRKDKVRLKDVTILGQLDLTIEKGTAEINVRRFGGETNLETTKGIITVRIPSNTGAVVDFAGGSRSLFRSDFSLQGSQTSGRAIREIRGTINQGGTHMRLRTDKGTFLLCKPSSRRN
jgi:hypothetical protein